MVMIKTMNVNIEVGARKPTGKEKREKSFVEHRVRKDGCTSLFQSPADFSVPDTFFPH